MELIKNRKNTTPCCDDCDDGVTGEGGGTNYNKVYNKVILFSEKFAIYFSEYMDLVLYI